MLFFRSGILLASDTTILPNDWASMHRALWVNLPSSYKYSVGVVVQGHDNVIAAHIGKERNIIRQFQHFFHIAQAAARIEVKSAVMWSICSVILYPKEKSGVTAQDRPHRKICSPRCP